MYIHVFGVFQCAQSKEILLYVQVHVFECVCVCVCVCVCMCVPTCMYREELVASASNAADDKKVDILLQRDQTISEVCLGLHMYTRGKAWGAIPPFPPSQYVHNFSL